MPLFTGSGREYFGIWIANILLTIVTLGIYSAWATVRNNQYFYGNTRLDGASFQYLANPITILKGRLIALAALVIKKTHRFIANGSRYGTTEFELKADTGEYYRFFGRGLFTPWARGRMARYRAACTAMMVSGDLSAFSDATVVVPAVLMSLSYYRDMEREADTYALEALKENGIDPIHFANIMERLKAVHGEEEVRETAKEDNRWAALRDMLSSHPLTDERIERFKPGP